MLYKRSLLLFLISFCFISLLPASQTLYDRNSEEYNQTRLLCQRAGVVGPSSATPVNANELVLALDRIDCNLLPEYLKERYDELYKKILKSVSGFDFRIPVTFNPSLYIAKDQNQDRKNFFLSYIDEKPLLEFALKVSFSDSIYIETAMPIGNASPNSHIPVTSFDFIFNKNTAIFQLMPIIARGSFGNNNFSLYLGRTRHSMGSGFSGNLIVGDNYRYQEVFGLKFASNIFTYNISITHFDSQQLVEIANTTRSDSFKSSLFENPHLDGKQQTRVIHRFDVCFIDKARFVLDLGTLFYASSGFDFRFLFPFMINHSYYDYSENEEILENNFDEANNILAIELEWIVAPKFNLALQIAMDQFQLYNEGDGVPDSFGFMMTCSYVELGRVFDIEVFAELAYTMPFLYVAPKKDNGNYNWNYDYYLGYYSNEQKLATSREGAWSGYIYGPNSIVTTIGIFCKNTKTDFESRTILTYVAQGDQDKSIDLFYDSSSYDKLPLLGDIRHVLSIREDLSSWIANEFQFLSGIQFQYSNQNGKGAFDVQFYAGVCWHIT